MNLLDLKSFEVNPHALPHPTPHLATPLVILCPESVVLLVVALALGKLISLHSISREFPTPPHQHTHTYIRTHPVAYEQETSLDDARMEPTPLGGPGVSCVFVSPTIRLLLRGLFNMHEAQLHEFIAH